MEKTKQLLELIEPFVNAVAVINLKNIALNYKKIKKSISTDKTVGAVVKANAYGLGAGYVASILYKEDCRIFFVASIEEGIELRGFLKKDADIYILGGFSDGCEFYLSKYNLIPVINNVYQINLLEKYFNGQKKRVALNFNTGMNRDGLSKNDILENLDKVQKYMKVNFVMSHLLSALNIENSINKKQLEKYKDILKIFDRKIVGSLSASNGFFLGDEYHFDLLRIGKALYGFCANESMLPTIGLYARILQVNKISAGDSVGYDAKFVASKDMRIITVGIGYSDGLSRAFAEDFYGIINNVKLPIIGKISMDYTVMDASNVDIKDLTIGSWVELINFTDNTIVQLALKLKSLPHEISCNLGNRIKRVYINE